jgi:iron complex transport system substrate-binding protein
MRRSRASLAIVCAAISFGALTGCSTSQGKVIEISHAQTVHVTSHETSKVHRVVALANGSAEIISAMGLKEILVGRDIASTDTDLKSIPIVTSGHQVIPEKIISLHPDLVIIDKSTGPQSALDTLRSAGIRVVQTPEAWTLTDIPTKVSAIAKAIGVPQTGAQLVSEMGTTKASMLSKNGIRIAFLYLRGGSAIYLIGGKGSGADSLISAIGAVDVGAEKLPNPFNALTSEEMVALNPNVILVMTKGLQSVGGVSGLVALPGVAQTEAGKNRHVIAVDDSLLLSFGLRTPDLVKKLSRAVQKVSQ